MSNNTKVSEIPSIHQYITIDEFGLMYLEGRKIDSAEKGQEILNNISMLETGAWVSEFAGSHFYIEAFDEPLIADKIISSSEKYFILTPYGNKFEFQLKTLLLDEWDRFHGKTLKYIPFVFSRDAQNSFFELMDSFDDESITIDEKTISIPQYWDDITDVETEDYWTEKYQNKETRWDLGMATPGFTDFFPQLKVPPSRIIVLGGGRGHDAAYFASLGHFVTLVDISDEAIEGAKAQYQNRYENLKYLKCDIFDLPQDFYGAFDIVIEHTCYCAINPALRSDLVKQWSKLLIPGGHFFGVFFSMEKRSGPPFGGSEWELRERLKKGFRFLYWQRMRNSIDRRNGKEFLVYAQKK